ncbi:MAG: Glu/Leu/Phe/Val dehydrogenase [Proteobacteria bacterium]|nr:Glu/Leu/Phe/Val dehydrogenase [Pseudomonadota bacterium]
MEPVKDFDELQEYMESRGFGNVYFKFDTKTGLRAIIALHNIQLGPAIGGCRFIPYLSVGEAVKDVLRLAEMMTYKASVSGLDHGGGKAVIIKPDNLVDRKLLFESFGRFVEELGGRYITAVDSGTSPSDMDNIAKNTQYVSCTTLNNQKAGDPSPHTALGVRRGIQSSVKQKFGREDLEGIHVAIQGVGHVGYHLAKELHQLGAKLSVGDINPLSVEKCVKEFGAKAVAADEILQTKCDVLAPCALGGIISHESVQQLRTSIIAGAANSQLAHREVGELLHQKNILYAPDFVINAGGLIRVVATFDLENENKYNRMIDEIYNTLEAIYLNSNEQNLSTTKVAFQLARKRLF